MTTQNSTATLSIRADISSALTALDRLQDRARQTARAVNRAGGGAPGAALGGVGAVGRGGVGVGQLIGAGAGLQAGIAVFEQVFERMFELFEDTDILNTFTDALDTVFKAIAPLAGSIIQALTPAIVALEPALTALVPAIVPLIELIGTNLVFAIKLLSPLIEAVAPLVQRITEFVQRIINDTLSWIIRQYNKIPFLDDVEFQPIGETFEKSVNALADKEKENAEMIANAVRDCPDRTDDLVRAIKEGPTPRPEQARVETEPPVVHDRPENVQVRVQQEALVHSTQNVARAINLLLQRIGTFPQRQFNVPFQGTFPNPNFTTPFIGPPPDPRRSVPFIGPLPDPHHNVPFTGPIPNAPAIPARNLEITIPVDVNVEGQSLARAVQRQNIRVSEYGS